MFFPGGNNYNQNYQSGYQGYQRGGYQNEHDDRTGGYQGRGRGGYRGRRWYQKILLNDILVRTFLNICIGHLQI